MKGGTVPRWRTASVGLLIILFSRGNLSASFDGLCGVTNGPKVGPGGETVVVLGKAWTPTGAFCLPTLTKEAGL